VARRLISTLLTSRPHERGGHDAAFAVGDCARSSDQVTGGKQQQVTVPITFVSASGLPDFYMGQQLTNLANLDSGANDKTAEGARVSAGN